MRPRAPMRVGMFLERFGQRRRPLLCYIEMDDEREELYLTRFHPFQISFPIHNLEIHLALLNFFERDARGLMFYRVNINAWACAALKLLASLCGDYNQTIFRV